VLPTVRTAFGITGLAFTLEVAIERIDGALDNPVLVTLLGFKKFVECAEEGLVILKNVRPGYLYIQIPVFMRKEPIAAAGVTIGGEPHVFRINCFEDYPHVTLSDLRRAFAAAGRRDGAVLPLSAATDPKFLAAAGPLPLYPPIPTPDAAVHHGVHWWLCRIGGHRPYDLPVTEDQFWRPIVVAATLGLISSLRSQIRRRYPESWRYYARAGAKRIRESIAARTGRLR